MSTSAGFIIGFMLLAAAATSAADALEEGDAHWAAGRLDQAAASFQAAIRSDPGGVEPRMRLAGLHMSRQDYAGAIPLFQEAISLDGANDRAFIGLAIAYLHQRKTLMAEAAIHEALRINPARREALEPLLASIRARQDSPGEAHTTTPP